MAGKRRQILSAPGVKTLVEKLAAEIAAGGDREKLAIVGIRKRGVPLAERIAAILMERHDLKAEVGVLDITLYRDDLTMIAQQPVVGGTDIKFDITDKRIVLVDDVLFTGRTIRAALSELGDFGRPAKIELAALIDRGLRELPIEANYVGKTITTTRRQLVDVLLTETDGRDAVEVVEESAGDAQKGA
jgi:pyrimidine operon attenuation protein/uracil phosphoribosyltransferase